MQKPEMLSYRDAARMLGVPVSTVYGWAHRRQIPHLRLSSRMVRFRRDELEKWLEARYVPAVEPVPAEELRRRP
jgi:excisionase family DNA binding protein